MYKWFKLSEFDSPDRPGSGELMEPAVIQALDIARMDHVAALDFIGRAGEAIQASSRVQDPRRWPGMEHVHGALLASQGLALPGWTPGPTKQPCRLSVEERSTD